MPSDVMTDLIRGLIAPVARAFEAAGRAGRRGAVRRTISRVPAGARRPSRTSTTVC